MMIKKNVVSLRTTPCRCGKEADKIFGGEHFCSNCFVKVASAYKNKYGTTNDKSLDEQIEKLAEEHN